MRALIFNMRPHTHQQSNEKKKGESTKPSAGKVLTKWHHVPIIFQHHICIEVPLGVGQTLPLLITEVHSYILKCHWLLKQHVPAIVGGNFIIPSGNRGRRKEFVGRRFTEVKGCYCLVYIWGRGERKLRLSVAKNNERTNNPQVVCHPKKHPLGEGAPGLGSGIAR